MFEILRKQAFGITQRLRNRDFSGNTGLALKNSIYSFLTSAVSKGGSIIFIYLIMMRYLSEELFGLYSLALATIFIFFGFSDLGIGTALIRYVSIHGKNSKGYIYYLGKLKIYLTIFVCFALVLSSKFLAESYYGKPSLIGAFLAGTFYMVFMNISFFLANLWYADNNFKIPFLREFFFQISRIIIIPIIIFFGLTKSFSHETFLFFIFLGLALCFLLQSIFLLLNIKKYSGEAIDKSTKREINHFIYPLTLTALSGVFFGYIDMFMLGRFVDAVFIGYYQAAFSLISSAVVLISFSMVLFPLFSKLGGKRLDVGLRKSLLLTFPLALLAFIATLVLSPQIFAFVNFITGRDYTSSINILRVLSLLLLLDPFIGIFTSYFNSQGKTKVVAKSIIYSTLVNVLLNYFLITRLLTITGEMSLAVLGAAIATSISRVVFLGFLACSYYSFIKDKNQSKDYN